MLEEIRNYAKKLRPQADLASIVCGDKYRFTLLTNRLIRLEYQESGEFVDKATQIICNRQLDDVKYRVIEEDDSLEIVTDYLHLYYDKKTFSKEGLRIELNTGYGVYGSFWHFGDEVNDLRGTARTLDNCNGRTELDHGIMSREGFGIIDDSQSALIGEDGWLEPNLTKRYDIYFFGYGHDYLGCLKDFYRLTGSVPKLPRFALGNWWSRFYPYRQQEYLDLMDEFKRKDIPLSVSVIDMDWHKTRLPEKYGSGWTGYSWNRELFPEPDEFLEELHNRGLHTTLNLHPADGVKAHEDAYLAMAKAMGVDYEKEDKIPFDVTDPKFMDCYFKYLHNPLEDKGVDFWWIDWQQGSGSGMPGVDTLWMLNHLHFLDSGRNGRLPMTFSRFAGVGSHRYPIGFSGDTITSWESLAFQPYFTANATNIGYTWWSHDIGGHMLGERDDELTARWVQFGVFSPIMRLHSSASPFYGKEPWNYDMQTEKVISDFMRLRHRLIPYLYSANIRTAEEGMPLIRPMYYHHDCNEAYSVDNQYYFGESMIVCPIVTPMYGGLRLGKVKVYLPEGEYYDFFTGRRYTGGGYVNMHRSLESIPVLIPAGSIIPLAVDYKNSHISSAKELELRIYCGASGEYTLYDDDSASYFSVTENVSEIIVEADVADDLLIKIIVVGNDKNKDIIVRGTEAQICEYIPEVKADIFTILNRAQINYALKDKIYEICVSDKTYMDKIRALNSLDCEQEIISAVLELI